MRAARAVAVGEGVLVEIVGGRYGGGNAGERGERGVGRAALLAEHKRIQLSRTLWLVVMMLQLAEHQVVAGVAILVMIVERAGQRIIVAVMHFRALPEQTKRFAAFLFCAARCRHATRRLMTQMLIETELMLLTDHAVRLRCAQLGGAR